jgi:hypothetical protein
MGGKSENRRVMGRNDGVTGIKKRRGRSNRGKGKLGRSRGS